MNLIISSIIVLGIIGLAAAIILYFVAQKFKVEEDTRIDVVTELLPGANCGGCGYPGCRGFAEACVKADTLENMLCPVGGLPTMCKVSEVLGHAVCQATPKIAVVRCNGTCQNRPRTNKFDGAHNCKIAAQLYAGETNCSYGCFGFGDCVAVCQFDAIKINPETGIPEIDEEKCTACGACAKTCPKKVIELRNKGVKGRRVFVSCVNKDKGGVARKACSAACIGCGKCQKVCPFGAIKIENNLAYIDFELCRSCRKCVNECPTGAIHDVNFPTPAPVATKPVAVKTETLKVVTETTEPQKEIKPQPITQTEEKEQQPKVETQNFTTPIKEVIEEIKEEVVEIIEDIKEEVEEVVEEIKEEIEEIKEEIKEEIDEIKEEIKEEVEEIKEKIENHTEDNKKIDDFNNTPVSELIDESLRITPREKKEPKQTKKANTNDNMQSLNF
ncbi:MAG: Fe-S cluster domain-containing protein [Paludibacteraceae bacterium]|nr:Fe-S cluster domain-containing protein [Paludibacteraceae bacterium]